MGIIIDTIKKRRSIRAYQERPLDPSLIRTLLEAAMAAPTACNSQPWEMVVVTDPIILDQLRGKLLSARYNAPCAIVVCGNPSIANNSAAKYYWVQDCSAAMENILIAAAGMDLGSVWIGIYPLASLIQAVREILNIPQEVTPLGIAYLGYPADGIAPPSKTKYEERRVHWQMYEHRKPRAKKKNARYEA